MWWFWDYTSNRLYVINTKSKTNSLQLKSYQFPDSCFTTVFTFALPPLSTDFGIVLFFHCFKYSLSITDIDTSFPYPYSFFARPHPTTSRSTIAIIKLPKNGHLCLCVQCSNSSILDTQGSPPKSTSTKSGSYSSYSQAPISNQTSGTYTPLHDSSPSLRSELGSFSTRSSTDDTPTPTRRLSVSDFINVG